MTPDDTAATPVADGLPYDAEARRETPLAKKLVAQIKERGPITVSVYMAACLFDDEYGYYRKAPAIGAESDFTTAPEISQLFGEIVGLWAAVVWKSLGAPERFNLVELGPGRGSLMADALRAGGRMVPGFIEAADVRLVETNETLQGVQKTTLAPFSEAVRSLVWHPNIEDIWWDDAAAAKCPTLLVGNEFLDAVPADQYGFTETGWQARRVGLDANDRLIFTGPHESSSDKGVQPLETAELARFSDPERGQLATVPNYGIVDLIVSPWPTFAALLIDYGHEDPAIGDTLQAVRKHKYEHPLTSPGEADLTTQVDFSAVVARARGHRDDIEIDGPLTQAEFLGRLGILQRGSKLMALNPDKASDIEASVLRLMAPNGMGTRFKVLGMRSRNVPTLPGLEPRTDDVSK